MTRFQDLPTLRCRGSAAVTSCTSSTTMQIPPRLHQMIYNGLHAVHALRQLPTAPGMLANPPCLPTTTTPPSITLLRLSRLSHSSVHERLRCILVSGRFWEDCLVSAKFMEPRGDPIPVKINGPALELKPKRDAAPGEGRPPQISSLAGAKGHIVCRLVSTTAAQDSSFNISIAHICLTSVAHNHLTS